MDYLAEGKCLRYLERKKIVLNDLDFYFLLANHILFVCVCVAAVFERKQ